MKGLSDVKYHFIREKVTNGIIDVIKINIKENLANFGTKVLTIDKLALCRDLFHVDEV